MADIRKLHKLATVLNRLPQDRQEKIAQVLSKPRVKSANAKVNQKLAAYFEKEANPAVAGIASKVLPWLSATALPFLKEKALPWLGNMALNTAGFMGMGMLANKMVGGDQPAPQPAPKPQPRPEY